MAVDLGNIILHQDNAPAHTAATTCLEIELLGFDLLEHPPYSPDLAPMDFAIFPFIKSQLREDLRILMNLNMQFEPLYLKSTVNGIRMCSIHG